LWDTEVNAVVLVVTVDLSVLIMRAEHFNRLIYSIAYPMAMESTIARCDAEEEATRRSRARPNQAKARSKHVETANWAASAQQREWQRP
jgi:hypothetical protein